MSTIYQRIKIAVVPKSVTEWAFCLVFVVPICWTIVDEIRCGVAARSGTAVAKADVGRGVYRYHLWGKAHVWDRDAIEIAKREFGIQIVRTGGCLVGGPDSSFDFAYNRVVIDFFRLKLGIDPVMKVFDTARSEWLHQHEEKVETKSSQEVNSNTKPE